MEGDEVLRFGHYALDLGRGVLLGHGGTRLLRPRAQALLTHLARNPGRVVPKAELLDAGWPGLHVTEDSLTQCIREIRKALADDAQSLIRTIARRGYMLAVEDGAPPPRSSQPVVAVLRFRREVDDDPLSALLDGFAEDLIAGLARFGTLTVLAGNSSFAVSDETGNRADIGRRLGADYLVEGAVRGVGSARRITASLIDARTLQQLWTDRFDIDGAEFFSAQDDIVECILGRLTARLDDAGARRARAKPVSDLSAYEAMLQGLAVLRTNDPARYPEACTLLETAIAKEPDFGLAHAHLAFGRAMLVGFGRAKRPDLDAVLKIAAKAVDLAPDQSTCFQVLSFIEMYRHEHAAAEQHLRHALTLNPCDAESLEQMGYLLTLRGRPVEALQWMDRAVRLNPIHPNWYEHDRSFALYALGDYAGAAELIKLTPAPPAWMQTWLAACYAQSGDAAQARAAVARIAEIDPGFSPDRFADDNGAAFEHAADIEHFASGVRNALALYRGGGS
jgi:TolB-like protein